MEKTTEQKAQEILDFFQTAFCAEKAQFATGKESEALKASAVIKLTATDGRGVFYVAQMIPSENSKG